RASAAPPGRRAWPLPARCRATVAPPGLSRLRLLRSSFHLPKRRRPRTHYASAAFGAGDPLRRNHMRARATLPPGSPLLGMTRLGAAVSVWRIRITVLVLGLYALASPMTRSPPTTFVNTLATAVFRRSWKIAAAAGLCSPIQ